MAWRMAAVMVYVLACVLTGCEADPPDPCEQCESTCGRTCDEEFPDPEEGEYRQQCYDDCYESADCESYCNLPE